MQTRISKGFAGVLLFLVGCTGHSVSSQSPSQGPGGVGQPSVPVTPIKASPTPGIPSTPGPSATPSLSATPGPSATPADPGFSICSALSFAGVTFRPDLSSTDQEALKLSLNISGSFEGDTGWVNLTGNFDGQGLSMGLLNQNFGQGSLQPLWIEMRDRHFDVLQGIFSPAHLQSLLAMLSQWQKSTPASTAASLGRDHMNNEPRLSLLDKPANTNANTAVPESASGNAASVQWAVNNLYTDGGTMFTSQWRSELTALGQNPAYVSVQLEAAMAMYDRALSYEAQIRVRELRAYLMLFDINVQNGGLYGADLSDYAAWLSQNPDATNTQRLDEILSLRLRHVQSQYVSDVRSRKQAIIDGTGVVHGDNRNLPAEYCYPALFHYR